MMFVKFLKTVTIATLRKFKLMKPVTSMPTKNPARGSVI